MCFLTSDPRKPVRKSVTTQDTACFHKKHRKQAMQDITILNVVLLTVSVVMLSCTGKVGQSGPSNVPLQPLILVTPCAGSCKPGLSRQRLKRIIALIYENG